MNVEFEIISNGIIAKLPGEKMFFPKVDNLLKYLTEEQLSDMAEIMKHHNSEGDRYIMSFNLSEKMSNVQEDI